MNRKYRFNLIVTSILGLGLALMALDSFAQGPNRNSDRGHQERQVLSSRISHPGIGQRVSVIPNSHQVVRVGPQNYHYYNGSFYRRANQGGYVVVSAPLNARVGSIPRGAISFGIGSRRYYYANFTYYLWDQDRRDYIVVEEPEGAETEVVSASESSGELFVYPSEGQSDEQRDKDRYECYLWASDQTGFDPIESTQNAELASNYRRAMSACLEGRGYTVN